MKNMKYVISIVLIIVLFLVTYLYFNRTPVENVPTRATLVFEHRMLKETGKQL